jgi:YggT family protein
VVAWSIIATLLLIFLILLVMRLIFDWVFVLARGFRPTGPLVLLLEVIYSATDPPLKALRRVIPPIRVGQVSLDLGFYVLFLVLFILYQTARSHA